MSEGVTRRVTQPIEIPDSSESSLFGVRASSYHINTEQEIIVITVDRLIIQLRDNWSVMERSRDWLIPFGVFLTGLITLITTDFNDTYVISASVWEAIFIIVTAVTFLVSVGMFWRRQRCPTVDEMVQELKAESKTTTLKTSKARTYGSGIGTFPVPTSGIPRIGESRSDRNH